MKIKPKGRKIYRYKTRFERLKGFLKNTGAVLLTIGGVAVLVFVGYSAGGPIMEFLEEQELIVPATEPAATSAPAETETFSETMASSMFAETQPSETDAVQTTQPVQQEETWMCGYYLDTDALLTETALQKAVAGVPEGITHVIVPLKAKGGRLYFASENPDAGLKSAVAAAMPLETIYTTISQAGYTPVAGINALEDSVYPQIYPESGYQIAGTRERWLDAAPENGGKPWLSPFSGLTSDYLAAIAGEIAAAGFPVILCDGLMFPAFSEDDLGMLDPRAGAADRGSALAVIVNTMQQAAEGTEFYLTIDGAEMLDSGSEILKAGISVAPDVYVIRVSAEGDIKKAVVQALLQDTPCIMMGEGDLSPEILEIDGNYIMRPVVSEPEEPVVTDTTEPAGTADSAAEPET